MHARLSNLVALAAAAGLVVIPGSIAGEPPEAAAAEAAQAAPQREFRDADELLTALEEADRDLVSLTGAVRYDRTSALAQDHQVSLGRLYFVTGLSHEGEPEGDRMFAIRFDTLVLDGAARPEEKLYIFDGRWLVEKLPEERLFVKREVVPPGENFDPLRIGEGPMPLPIGQKREDILRRYAAELRDTADGLEPPPDALPEEIQDHEALMSHVKDSYQMRLVPLPEWAEEDDFTEVRLWYQRGETGRLLPRLARTVNRAGDISLVWLVGVQVQMAGEPANPAASVPPDVLDTRTPLHDWHVQIVDWRGRAADGPHQQPER